MSEYTIYHNPRCSKSRATLQLLQEHGVEPDVLLYLDTPPDAAEIRSLLEKTGLSAAQLVRKGEPVFKEAGLSADSSDDEESIEVVLQRAEEIEPPSLAPLADVKHWQVTESVMVSRYRKPVNFGC